MKTHTFLIYATTLFLSIVEIATAQTFDLSWHTVDGGGAIFTTGGSFELSGTIGQPDAGVMTGGTFELTGGFWSVASPATPPGPGDCDADGDVDLTDYGNFASCLSGPATPAPSGCECSDVDADSDVDLRDYAEFQAVCSD